MHQFHEYLSKQIAEKLAKRRVVVWYDSRREFVGFVGELRGGRQIDACALERVAVEGGKPYLCCYMGSQFELKHVVDPVMAKMSRSHSWSTCLEWRAKTRRPTRCWNLTGPGRF